MLSDDSDDDSLLDMNLSFTKKRKRTAEKARMSDMAYLDDQLEYAGKAHRRMERKEQMKREEAAQDESLAKAESVVQNASATKGRRRSDIQNEIEGIEAAEDNGMDADRRAALASAITTGKSSLLGVRKTLDPLRAADAKSLFVSEQNATSALKNVLKEIEKDSSKKSLTKVLRNILRDGMLLEFLEECLLVDHVKTLNEKVLPKGLCDWLFCVACSGDCDENFDVFTSAAHKTLLRLLKDGFVPSEPIMTMKQVVPRLESWFGLSRASEKNETQSDQPNVVQREIALGLLHFFQLSKQCIATYDDCVEGDDSAVFSETASECLCALERAGLDVAVHSGRDVLEALQSVLHIVLGSVVARLSRDELSKWMDSAVVRILNQCPTLGPGSPSTEDQDDTQAWLCLFLMVWLFPIDNESNKIQKELAEFKAWLAIGALQKCLGYKDWDGHVESFLEKDGNEGLARRSKESLQWKAIASAYVGLVSIEMIGDELIMDGPRCLATVQCVCAAVQAGFCTYLSTATTKDSSSEMLCSPEDIDTMVNTMNLLDEQYTQFLRRVKLFSSQAHYRRAVSVLTYQRAYFRHVKVKLAGNGGSPVSVQQSIESWLTPTAGRVEVSDDEIE